MDANWDAQLNAHREGVQAECRRQEATADEALEFGRYVAEKLGTTGRLPSGNGEIQAWSVHKHPHSNPYAVNLSTCYGVTPDGEWVEGAVTGFLGAPTWTPMSIPANALVHRDEILRVVAEAMEPRDR